MQIQDVQILISYYLSYGKINVYYQIDVLNFSTSKPAIYSDETGNSFFHPHI